MAALIMPIHSQTERGVIAGDRMQVMVNVQAEVLHPEMARRMANGWLLDHAGNLLGAENPELILDDPMRWRCDVILGVPNLQKPGAGDRLRIGHISMDAVSGEILNSESLAEELQNNAAVASR